MKKSIIAAVIASFTLNVTSAFASGTHGGGHGPDIGEPGEASEVTRIIEITMGDNYYEPEELSIKEGETVKFIIKNEGDFVHEFNIGTAAMHAKHQEEMEMMVEHGVLEVDRINHDAMKMEMKDEDGNVTTMEHDDPNSVLLEPGKTAEITWEFDTEAKLEFACNVPGHYDSGMNGKINIKH